MTGIRNANWIPIKSAVIPCNNGKIAPPTIAKHKTPAPLLVIGPNLLIAKVKIVGNIIELNKPTAKILHIATNPLVLIDIKINAKAPIANQLNTFDGAIIFVK